MLVRRVNNEESRKDINELYRVMTLEQFLNMFLYEQNTLLHPDCWEDPFEKMLMKSKINRHSKDKVKVNKLNWARWYGQCWSSVKESDGIWRSFTHNKEIRCVKIKTTRDKLEKCCSLCSDDNTEFYIDEITYAEDKNEKYNEALNYVFSHYLDVSKSVPEEQYQRIAELSLLLTKRVAFKHENEVRLLAYRHDGTEKQRAWSYRINVDSLIDEIEFDPWAPNYSAETYRKLMDRLGVKAQVKFSELYKDVDKRKKGYIFVMKTKKM